MSEERFPYLKNFLKPTNGASAISDKTSSEEVSALLAPEGLVRPGKIFPSREGDMGGLLDEFQHGEVPPRQNHERVPQVQPLTSPTPPGAHSYLR
jgi:hypothetical protein